ncbi:MAG: preprotein translocase subunit YajC [Nocardioides sp.]
MEGLVQLLPLVAIALLFWFLIIRPQSRRQKEQVRMQSSLAVGDQVILTSGFYGTLMTLHDDRVEVELSPGTTVTVARAAIGTVVPVVSDEPESYDDPAARDPEAEEA